MLSSDDGSETDTAHVAHHHVAGKSQDSNHKQTGWYSQRALAHWRTVVAVVGVVVVALLVSLALVISRQTSSIRQTMDDAAYQNMETMMRTIASTVSSTFLADQTYMQSMASTVEMADDMQAWIDAVDFDTNKILNLYYGYVGSDTAYGKNGATLDLAGLEFTEHKNGQVRSGAYMASIGSYAYLVRQPILEDGQVVGYLYGEFLMSRFYTFLPQIVTDINDISLLEASTMRYIHIPSRNGSGTHINYDVLKYQTGDAGLAQQIVSEVQQAIQDKRYYMRILTFNRSEDGEMVQKDYVVFLWPIDDGEYYLSGVSNVDSLQSERISVLHTINLMVALIVGVSCLILALLIAFFAAFISGSKRRALIQKKHNQELDEALHIATAANESKSNFLSNMSHDIRTPMNAIIGFTTLINKEADDPAKVREYTNKISVSGDYLLSLINDVLDMSKIESGKTTLSVSQFNVHEVVSEAESIIRMQAEAKHQELSTDVVDVAHTSLMGDKLRIRQIILNLLSNAVKYTPAGGEIRFTVQGVRQGKQGIQALRIVVQDNGYGMDAEYAKTIFDPFVRLNNSMTGNIQGTGLGLAITKNIVDLMGGTISVRSALGEGSEFTVELELPVADRELPPAHADRAAAADALPSLDGLRILAAEDNELNAEILTELLAMENASCEVCADGQKIVDRFERSEPGDFDLILMDVQMPNMNGYEATRAIRASSHPSAKDIPIIAMTANAFAEDVMDAMQAGMDDHIAKPIDMLVLKKSIHNVVARRKKADSI